MPYIYYSIQFQKDQAKIQILIDSGSEINAITPAYMSKLGFIVWATSIRAQKIDGFILQTIEMVYKSF